MLSATPALPQRQVRRHTPAAESQNLSARPNSAASLKPPMHADERRRVDGLRPCRGRFSFRPSPGRRLRRLLHRRWRKQAGKNDCRAFLERPAVSVPPGGPGGMQAGISESLSQDTAAEPFTRILGCSHCFRDCVRGRGFPSKGAPAAGVLQRCSSIHKEAPATISTRDAANHPAD